MRYYFLICIIMAGILLPLFTRSFVYDIQEFYVDSKYEPAANFKERAVLLTSSSRAQFFVEEDYYDNLSDKVREAFLNNVANLGVAFDANIYFKIKSLFGDEWIPGIDKDFRITIYMTEMKDGIHGYFREDDEYEYWTHPTSNRREMIYINAKYVTQDMALAILAHEFQHLINFNQKRRLRVLDEERWLNEAFSEYAVTFSGFDRAGDYLANTVRNFLANPTDALGIWDDTASDQASVSLFVHYLAGQYGEDILRDIVQSNFTGGKAINYALSKNGFAKTFSDIFQDWTLALFLNSEMCGTDSRAYDDETSGTCYGDRYKFNHPNLQYDNLHLMPQLTYSVGDSGINASFAVRDLAPQWHRFLPAKYTPQNPKTLNIIFNSRNDNYFRVPVVVTFLSGDVEILETKIKDGGGSIEIPDFNTKVSSVVIIPASHTKLFGFSPLDPLRTFSYLVSMNEVRPRSVPIRGGDLIRAENRPEVYVVKDNYIRHFQHPIFFDFYGHFKWENVKVVSRDIVENYKEAKLIRKTGDYKVYEVVGFRQKRWLNMTATEFEASGRKWEEVYEVNNAEFSWYKTI